MGDLDEELPKMLLIKEQRIQEMERLLWAKEQEVNELKRKLHKCQSVLPSTIGPRTRRAQGISAEPQSSRSYQELTSEALQKHLKSDRQELFNFFCFAPESRSRSLVVSLEPSKKEVKVLGSKQSPIQEVIDGSGAQTGEVIKGGDRNKVEIVVWLCLDQQNP
ncbi:hypothetical protein DNTS_005957 [Danionella cerebrum]|uniref:cGMP-dependent protein kinase N-terminal coiled-coil domain-containing protein n=1 Tax=Danionella cerebrum TaxID=2873325 RepID=A0A553RFX6_9TELE|nr:hypothetical protein DNTS_005957 [Danionella translucida]